MNNAERARALWAFVAGSEQLEVAVVACVTAALDAREREVWDAAIGVVDGMVVGGRAWTQAQQSAATVLLDAADALRAARDGKTPVGE